MIDSLDDLDKALKILRANGVTKFEANGLKMELGEMPVLPHLADATAIDQAVIPPESELDRMVGMPVQGLEDPFLTYSVSEPLADENTAAEG